jgi:hypothetical protein
LSSDIITALSTGPRTAAELAAELARPVDQVVRQLSRLAGARRVEVTGLVRRPPAKRPLAIYGTVPPGCWTAPRVRIDSALHGRT